jgi:hypothetical protein
MASADDRLPQGLQRRLDAFDRMNPVAPSRLVAHCIDKWGFGCDFLSAIEIQAIMECVVADGCHHPEIELLADIGTGGKHPQNCDRDLKLLLVDPNFQKASSTITLPIKVSQKGPIVQQTQTVLWPHLVFANLFSYYRDAFNTRFLGGVPDGSGLAKFWNDVKDTSLYRTHPIKDRPDHTERCVPISIFGDGVPVAGIGKSWGVSAEVFSFSGVLNSKGYSILAQIMIFFIMSQCRTPETMDVFFAQLAWSLQWLQLGRHPTHGPPPGCERYTTGIERDLAGTFLAGGYYCALWLLRGDLDYYQKTLNLESHGSNHPCFLCQANAFDWDLPWTDFRMTAKYLATIWTNVAWKLARPHRHRLLQLVGMGIEQAQPDTMHTKHGGVDAYFYGSRLKYLVFFVMVGEPADNLARLWIALSREFKRRAPTNQLTGITMGMFDRGNNQFPLLKARAAQIKNLGPVLFVVWKTFEDRTEQGHRLITRAFEGTLGMDRMIDATADEYVMKPSSAVPFLASCREYLQSITGLRTYFQLNHPTDLLFHITVKCHYLIHIAMNASNIHPTLSWCYNGEDFVGRMKKIISACTRGTPARLLVSKGINRYIHGMGLRLSSDGGNVFRL